MVSASQDRNHELMERGSDAAIIQALLRPYLAERMNIEIAMLDAEWRGGPMSHDKLVGHVARMSLIREIDNQLESIQRQANYAAEKELGNGKA